ncbi:hypothetical protein DY000_02009713 [Brassica cretica]|uniref:Ig-like domain-containing protein n=1 Tax=Brassica cretica TaxID=69181 RepID=A0ABQ7CCG7_BRACR|nr:hypothetical protein DY000_02009713 [Brassica cretica]
MFLLGAVRFVKETWLDTDERIEITYPSHDQGKSSNNSNNGSGHSSISYDDSDNETGGSVSEVITVISVPSQNVSVAGDALFLCYIANMSVESRV